MENVVNNQEKIILSPPGEVGMNNGNYKRIFVGLESWLDQDVTEETIGELRFNNIFERDLYIETLKLQDWT